MMKVCYSEMDTPAGLSCRLEADGHAGYAPAGQDIVCAGASTVMQGLVYLLDRGRRTPTAKPLIEPEARGLAVSVDAPCEESGARCRLSWPKPALHCWPNATRRMSALQM